MAVDQGIATKLLNDMLFVLSGGIARGTGIALDLTSKLITLELTAAGIWLAVGHRHAAAAMLSKLLWLGLLTWFLRNWGTFALIFLKSMGEYGLHVGGDVITVETFLNPGQIMHYGLEIVGVLFAKITLWSGFSSVMNLGSIAILGFAAIGIWLAFFILAGQIFIRIIEFHLTAAVTLILLPFSALRYTAFLGEKAFAAVIAHGVGLCVLAVIASAGLPFLITLQITGEPTYGQAFTLLGAAGLVGMLAWHAPAVAAGIFTGAPSLTAHELASGVSSAARGVTAIAGSSLRLASGGANFTRQAVAAGGALRRGEGLTGARVATQGVSTSSGGARASAASSPVTRRSGPPPEPWMAQSGGAAGLSDAYRASAQRSYNDWQYKDKYPFESYVDYTQNAWKNDPRTNPKA
jgi:type IV secretion system protein TrbL